jgi:hypothetical protein
MDRFFQFAFSLTLRDAFFAALTAFALMVAYISDLPRALVIGGHIALAFSLFQLYRVSTLTLERVRRSEPWRVLKPSERPLGEFALVRARDGLKDVLLRFSKTSAGVACTLFILSLGTSLSGGNQCVPAGPCERHAAPIHSPNRDNARTVVATQQAAPGPRRAPSMINYQSRWLPPVL